MWAAAGPAIMPSTMRVAAASTDRRLIMFVSSHDGWSRRPPGAFSVHPSWPPNQGASQPREVGVAPVRPLVPAPGPTVPTRSLLWTSAMLAITVPVAIIRYRN
ncbi:MAG: hypothetical protein EA388_11340 [Nitriliruptor sp.]|nr:MAG: hypothetical protein EA388_11340 [Nitriliruptor sp.]